MKKSKPLKAIDSIIMLMILMAFFYAALVFLSGTDYANLIQGVLGILAALIGLIILSAFSDMKVKKRPRKVFILYSEEDLDFVSKLYKALKVTPYRILWDRKEIKVGDNIMETLERILNESDDVIFVVSKHSAESDESKMSLEKARNQNKRILPVLIDDSELPEEIQEIMFADFRESFDDGYFSLRDALKTTSQQNKQVAPPSRKAAS
ncbi:toll/interleukin-1 receptor domain-containing protein [Thiorhodococcus fuscus]|uniref:Toll/interleukin-1 receptor domain-containing protein n=1 Tax=Thiorhodococcus fuscus TaxID=527200 RepID=A0ABW4YEH9_9GAMM